MMTRRDWLVRVIGATAAATVAPLLDLTDTTPAFWNQEPLKKFLPWRIVFSDGRVFSFDARVVEETVLKDGSISLSVQPMGALTISEEQGEHIVPGGPTVLHREDAPSMELQAIDLPDLPPVSYDEDNYVIGQLKRSNPIFTVKL